MGGFYRIFLIYLCKKEFFFTLIKNYDIFLNRRKMAEGGGYDRRTNDK